jgi:D-serine deaminase-like pyridoxal phosphate-dependent protein
MQRRPPIGIPVEQLDTPALLVQLEALERNNQKMADFFAGRPAALRPHTKTHKCPQIALRQLRAGAIGITCAKVGEAEVMAEAGMTDILIANQVTGEIKIDRLTELARRCDMMVAVDDAANVGALSGACTAKGVTLRVLVEVNIGMGRCGVEPGRAAVDLAQVVAEAPNLQFKGLMGYEGHLVLVKDPQERERRVREAFGRLRDTADQLTAAGLPVEIVSGGGTGTYDVTADCPPVTEVQAGSYVFMDNTYRGVRSEFEPSLSVLTTVVSRAMPERAVVDAGLKAMTTELGLPRPLGAEGVSVRHLSEEHGVLDLADPEAISWRPGDQVRFLPSHCCTTVNLYDFLHVVQDGRLVEVWPVAGRGRSQ